MEHARGASPRHHNSGTARPDPHAEFSPFHGRRRRDPGQPGGFCNGAHPRVQRIVRQLPRRPAESENQLGDGSSELWTVFQDVTAEGWSDNERQKLLSRYLGFPLWDGLIYPTISLTELPQLTQIDVSQFSPLTATALTAFDENGHQTAKLKGLPLHHFAAFLNVTSRENDYLWGRLDGAEMILRTLQEVHLAKTAPNAAAPQAHIPHLASALQSVLDTETDSTRISQLRECLQKQVADLAAHTPAAQRTPSGGPSL